MGFCHVSFAADTIEDITSDIVAEKKPVSVGDRNTLLLRPKVEKIIYEYDIYVLNREDILYYSLADVIDILELAIDFDESTGVGQGWFLREDWTISIDLRNNQIISKGQTYNLRESNVIEEGEATFIDQTSLAEIFDMEFKPDIPQQYLEIVSPYPLPGVARYYRKMKKGGNNSSFSQARLPRKKIEYDWLDINTADVRLRSRYRRPPVGKNDFFRSGSIALEGQALKHQAYTFVNADSRNNLTNVIARLSKRDEDPTLLGPIKARSYEIGDSQSTDIALTGDSRQELGFHASNNSLENVQFLTTDINGDALPGWDVELYRNGILLSSLIVTDDAFYEFPDVQLFAGDNEFELFFYGPQGEIRNRRIDVPVTGALLATQDNTYDFSVSLSETNTYQKLRTDDVDYETPHIAARYNKTIGGMLTYLGVRNRDIEGENKTFLGTGFTKLVKNTIIDGNFGVDNKANTAAQLTVRKNINDWNLSASGLLQSDDYIVNESKNPKVMKISGNAQRSFAIDRRKSGSIFTGGEYSQTSDDRSLLSGRLGGSYQQGRLNFSNSLFYEDAEQTSGNSTTRLDNNFSVRANFGNVFVRGGIDYSIQPVSEVDRYFSQINYYPTNRFSGEVRLDHAPNRDFTELRVGANYTNDYFRTSPFFEIDNSNELLVGLNLNFNLIDTPFDRKPMITSDRSVGRGLVSSFVYHDKNGNNLYDEADEPLPEVAVKSVNVRRRAETNEKGYSLINNLPTTRATDIELDQETLPDAYMISGTEGVSILPSAGEIVELDFPVHLSGEIDGTVSLRNREGILQPLKRANIVLYPLNNSVEPIEVAAAFDGFYVASLVPPGQYIATVSNDTAKAARASVPTPTLVNVGYDGDVIYGLNFELDQSSVNVPTDVVYSENLSPDILYALKVNAQTKTKLLGLLKQIKGHANNPDIYAGLEAIKDMPDGSKVYKLPSNDLKASHTKCKELAENAVPCILQVYVPSDSVQLTGLN